MVINLHLEAVASIKLNYLHFKLKWLLWLLITFPSAWSSRELLTNTPSTVLKQVLNEDAFESLQIPLDRAWFLIFCYPAEKCQAFPCWINRYYPNAPSSACCKQSEYSTEPWRLGLWRAWCWGELNKVVPWVSRLTLYYENFYFPPELISFSFHILTRNSMTRD